MTIPARSFEFRGGASDLQSCTDPEVILSGPAETGKTIGTLYKMHAQAMKWRNFRGAIVRKVRADMDSTVLRTWEEKIIDQADGVKPYGGSKPEWYEYTNGARVFVGGMDRPGKVLSGELDAVCVNQAEELGLADWETLTTRTTGRAGNAPYAQVFGDCNPGAPTHWILNRPSLRILESRHEHNPRLHDGAGWTHAGIRTLAVLDALTGVRRERLRFGRWASAEGAVYEFDRAVHLVDPFPIPQDWRRFRSIDFGYSNPFVCQWWALDGDGRMYLYREIYMSQRTVRAHSAQIHQLTGDERIEVTVTDHDAEDRATLQECGIYTLAAIKDISPGVQAVQSRLVKAGDGRPRLYIMRGATVERDERIAGEHKPVSTEQEFDGYTWPKSGDGRTVKEAPVKVNDHGMDTLRYAVMYADRGSPVGFAEM